MTVRAETTALIATFDDPRAADAYLAELKQAGFHDDEVGQVSLAKPPADTLPEEGAATGAVTGGVLGAVTGAVVSGLVPGIGTVVAAGLLTGVLGGATAGATIGGLFGALLGLGLSEEEAQRYEQEVRAGRTLVVVQAVGRGGDAITILRRLRRKLRRDGDEEDGSET
jgi:hypothetical protein